jgi:hypothetical protein
VTTQTPEQFAAGLEQVAGRGGFYRAFMAEMQAGALDAEGKAKVNATENPHVRTDRLRASVAGVVREGKGHVDLAVGSGSSPERPGVPYAGMQEFGGTQYPRKAKMLRIPLAAALTAAGVDRFPTPLRASAPGQFYVRRARDGRLFLHDRLTDVPWYRLADSSTIPGTHFLYRAFESATGVLEGRLRDLLEEVLDAAEKET